jgi:hypothetical protein
MPLSLLKIFLKKLMQHELSRQTKYLKVVYYNLKKTIYKNIIILKKIAI